MSLDFTSILAGFTAGSIITAVIAGATVLAAVLFARWGARKVARFFGESPTSLGVRTLNGWYAGNHQGYVHHPDEKAINKSVDRHMAKASRQ